MSRAATLLGIATLALIPLGAQAQRSPLALARDTVREELPVPGGHAFYFTRARYNGWGRGRGWGRGSWAIDFPKADRQFLIGLKHLTNIDAFDYENPVGFDDPNLRRFPFVYALEVGYMDLTEAEVQGLRSYLLAGGFLVIDDFWGTWEWQNFEYQIRRVLPEYEIVEIGMDHPLLRAFYHIDELFQVPARGRGINGHPTWEQDGYIPRLLGIFDAHDRLMVVINWNTDLGDAWEWAEDPWYPITYSNFAYQLGVNMVVYGMSH